MGRRATGAVDAAGKVPERLVPGEPGAGGKVSLVRPKAGRLGRAVLRAFRVDPHLRVHLDTLGSEVWTLIDGQRTAAEILARLQEAHPDEADLGVRLGQYLSTLASNRFIRLR